MRSALSYQPMATTSAEETLVYIDRLDRQSSQAVKLAETLPMPDALRMELQQTWRITRQKLAYFRRELAKAGGELREELVILHSALLPEVISYHVRLGSMMITDTCDDHRFLHRWNAIWTNIDA